jgi:ceramide glucosyltransferase
MAPAIDNDVLRLLYDVFAAAAGLGCLYLLIACVAVLRFARRREWHSASPLPVTILKPLRGAEPGLARRLTSFCLQFYAAPIQLLCGVRDPSDPAIETVRRMTDANPQLPIDLNIDASLHGGNHKVSNLINALPLARHDVVVMADSDIEVGPGYLASVVAELQRPGVGAVTCVYHGVAGAGVWSKHAALSTNSHFLPSAIVGLVTGLAKPCFGSTIAVHRSVLSEIGGFKPFADALADDYAIGNAIRSAGYRVAIPGFSLGHVCFHQDLRSLLADELRAARTIKAIRPLGYYSTILSHPFPLALLAALLGGETGVLLAAIALGARALLCRAVEHAFNLERQPYSLIPIRDLLSFAVFVLSFLGTSVAWRGASFRVTPDGSLVPDHNEAGA